MSLVVISEILGRSNRAKLTQPIQTQLTKKWKKITNYLLYFWNLHQILNFMKKMISLIEYVFLKLETAVDLVS